MAWRIDEQVVRGEIDNRTRGRITGRIWFVGIDEPVELELSGNAWRDLAGRRLEFSNPEPKAGKLDKLARVQRGSTGDCTASRKVKVPDIPLDQVAEYCDRHEKFPWHWGNALHLEWFSERNGCVVIETASFQLTVSGDSTWEMSADEEVAQRSANSVAMENFMGDLMTGAAAQAARKQAPADAENPDGGALSEEEADAMLAESDRLVHRIQGRLEREGPDADYEKIFRDELERRRRERGEPPLTPEQEKERAEWIHEMNLAAEEVAANPDVDDLMDEQHPLATRARELATRLISDTRNENWIDEHAQREHPLVDFVNSTTAAAGKLAGALNGREWPPTLDDCAMVVAWLKKARGFFDDALAAADASVAEGLADLSWLQEARSETLAIVTEADALIEICRARLEEG